MNVTEYRSEIVKHGIPVELPSSLHVKDLCESVFSSKTHETTRRVIEYGRFSSNDVDDKGEKIQKNFVIVPPDDEVMRDVVLDLMPVARKGTKGGYAALEILKALRPMEHTPKIKAPTNRLLYDPANNAYGDIAENHGGYELDINALSSKTIKVKAFEFDGRLWVPVAGDQIHGTNYYTIRAALAVPSDEWQADADLWHFYYGRHVEIGRKKYILGELVTFVPDKKPPKITTKRPRTAVKTRKNPKAEDGVPAHGWVY